MEKCSNCNKEFLTPKALKLHTLNAHIRPVKPPINSGRKFKKKEESTTEEWQRQINAASKGGKNAPGKCLDDNAEQERREKIAKAKMGNNFAKHRGDRQSFYNGIRMDSSWEVKVAEYLDANNISWTYGETVFPIDEKRSYRPDFKLSDGSFIEVKGFWRPENKQKFEEWKHLYPQIKLEIWDKEILKKLNII